MAEGKVVLFGFIREVCAPYAPIGLNMPVSTEHVAIYMPLEFVIISVMPLRAFFVLAPKNG